MSDSDQTELHNIRECQKKHEQFLVTAFGYGRADHGHFGRELSLIKTRLDVVDKSLNGNGRRGIAEKVAIMWAGFVPLVGAMGAVIGYMLRALVE